MTESAGRARLMARAQYLEDAILAVIHRYGDEGWAKSEMCRYLRKALAEAPSIAAEALAGQEEAPQPVGKFAHEGCREPICEAIDILRVAKQRDAGEPLVSFSHYRIQKAINLLNIQLAKAEEDAPAPPRCTPHGKIGCGQCWMDSLPPAPRETREEPR